MLTKKNDFYKDLNLSSDLTDIEIDFDGDDNYEAELTKINQPSYIPNANPNSYIP